MVVHHKQTQRKRNRERETERYKRKREKRAYLTEAFNDGELALYKPTPFTYKTRYGNNVDLEFSESGGVVTILNTNKYSLPEEEVNKPVKFNWFEKFLLWIKKWLS